MRTESCHVAAEDRVRRAEFFQEFQEVSENQRIVSYFSYRMILIDTWFWKQVVYIAYFVCHNQKAYYFTFSISLFRCFLHFYVFSFLFFFYRNLSTKAKNLSIGIRMFIDN